MLHQKINFRKSASLAFCFLFSFSAPWGNRAHIVNASFPKEPQSIKNSPQELSEQSLDKVCFSAFVSGIVISILLLALKMREKAIPKNMGQKDSSKSESYANIPWEIMGNCDALEKDNQMVTRLSAKQTADLSLGKKKKGIYFFHKKKTEKEWKAKYIGFSNDFDDFDHGEITSKVIKRKKLNRNRYQYKLVFVGCNASISGDYESNGLIKEYKQTFLQQEKEVIVLDHFYKPDGSDTTSGIWNFFYFGNK